MKRLFHNRSFPNLMVFQILLLGSYMGKLESNLIITHNKGKLAKL